MKATKPIIVSQLFDFDKSIVWQAITDPQKMRKWFFAEIEEFEAKVGFATHFNVGFEGHTFVHLWKITDVIPENKIVYSWKYQGHPGASVVTFELEKNGDSTLLTVRHTGIHTFPQDIEAFTEESCRGGWQYFIQNRLPQYLASL